MTKIFKTIKYEPYINDCIATRLDDVLNAIALDSDSKIPAAIISDAMNYGAHVGIEAVLKLDFQDLAELALNERGYSLAKVSNNQYDIYFGADVTEHAKTIEGVYTFLHDLDKKQNVVHVEPKKKECELAL